jgi:hypothetical protein
MWGKAATGSVAARASPAGSNDSVRLCGWAAWTQSSSPLLMIATLFTAAVRKNSPPERRMIQPVGAPVRWISHPPDR